MILDVDVGNTRIKWQVSKNGDVIAGGTQSTISVVQGGALEIAGVSSLQRARLSCVAGRDIAVALQGQVRSQFDIEIEEALVTARAAGVICGYKDPLQLGIDRWLAIVAAYRKHSQPVIIVDAGSAVTIDVVAEGGKHLGGYIVPGLELMHKCLMSGTERIQVESKRVHGMRIPGDTTDAAVDHGCLFLLVAMIESIVGQYQYRLMLTGGDGLAIKNQLKVDATYHPHLVIEGLSVDDIALRAIK